jgi:hypothetical protein
MPPLGYRHFDQVLDAARRKSIELDALQAYWLVSYWSRVMGKPEVILNWCYQANALIDLFRSICVLGKWP